MAVKKRYPTAFSVADKSVDPSADIDTEDVKMWTDQIKWWVSETQPNEMNPQEKAENILKAALNGTKINGDPWIGVERYSFRIRIKMLSGWDIHANKGVSGVLNKRLKKETTPMGAHTKSKAIRQKTAKAMEHMSITQLVAERDLYKRTLVKAFPWLDNQIYESKVTALAEAEVQFKSLSKYFLGAQHSELDKILKTREALRKDIGELMEFLGIHPKQLKDRVDQLEQGDVATLIPKWDALTALAVDYERVDAIQELIQSVRQAKQLRLDGAPQLADYMLWHKTGCPGHTFKCSCGKVWELYQGFTEEELIEAAKQAYLYYGFGLEEVMYKKEDYGDGTKDEKTPAEGGDIG